MNGCGFVSLVGLSNGEDIYVTCHLSAGHSGPHGTVGNR